MRRVAIIAIIILLFTPAALGATKYIYGVPELAASIAGVGEYYPGNEVDINVAILNKGLNEMKVESAQIPSGEDLPNTARMVTAGLKAGDSPVVIKTDPQMVGDIEGGSAVMVPFIARIPPGSTGGIYYLLLDISYTYLSDSEQAGYESIIYHYRSENVTLFVPIQIRPELYPEVIEVRPMHLNAGNEGYIYIKIENSGHLEGKSSIVRIFRSGESPVIPVDSSVYIGNFPPGSEYECMFKVKIDDNAERNSYPLNLSVEYLDDRGDTLTSDVVTVGVQVEGKIMFEVKSPEATINKGDTETLVVKYINTGETKAYSAQARLSPGDSFTCIEDTAYLGDIGPGERVTARFDVTADKSATEKEYGLDTEIRYRDALDNSHISESMKVKVLVVPRTGLGIVLSSPVLISIIVSALILGGYYVYHKRKR